MSSPRSTVLRVGSWSAELGNPHLFDGLNATLAYRLEPDATATRFPALLEELWAGRLTPERADAALAELETAARELCALGPERVVWSIEDLRRIDSPDVPVNLAATTVADYFVAPDGRRILDVLREAIQEAKLQNRPVTVDSSELRKSLAFAACLTVGGLLATYVAFRWFPDVVVSKTAYSPSTTSKHGLMLWVLLLLCAGQGAVLFLFGAFPRLGAWWAERRAVSWTVWIGIVVVAMTLGWK